MYACDETVYHNELLAGIKFGGWVPNPQCYCKFGSSVWDHHAYT